MNDFLIEDWQFDLAVNDYGATQDGIHDFINDLAGEFGVKWSPDSDGYRLHNVSDDAYVDLSNSLDDRIAEWFVMD